MTGGSYHRAEPAFDPAAVALTDTIFQNAITTSGHS